MHMVINPDVRFADADLSAIPAFTDGTPGNTVYWDEMSKEQVRSFFDVGMSYIMQYEGCVGSSSGAEILGALEDTYPEWVAEFEDDM